MLNQAHNKGNINSNHSDILLYTLELLLSKRQRIIIISEDVEKREPSFTVVGLANRCDDNGK